MTGIHHSVLHLTEYNVTSKHRKFVPLNYKDWMGTTSTPLHRAVYTNKCGFLFLLCLFMYAASIAWVICDVFPKKMLQYWPLSTKGEWKS